MKIKRAVALHNNHIITGSSKDIDRHIGHALSLISLITGSSKDADRHPRHALSLISLKCRQCSYLGVHSEDRSESLSRSATQDDFSGHLFSYFGIFFCCVVAI